MKDMTCWEFDEVVHAFVRMELLDVSMREAVVEHAAHCDNCAQRLGEAGELTEMTQAAAESARELQAPAHLEGALLSAFRNQRWRRHTTLWRTFEWAAAGSAAVVLTMVFWTSITRSKISSSPVQRKGVSSPSRGPLDADRLPDSQPDEGVSTTELTASIGDSERAYSVSDFVPVPFSEAMGTEDPGMVVRVQMTRASLAELGYPVAETPDEDLIRADVLVGEDGWPRGVRLVQ